MKRVKQPQQGLFQTSESCCVRTLQAGQALYIQGERVGPIYRVRRGVLKEELRFKGKRLVMDWAGSDQWVGLETLFGQAKRATTLEAITDAYVQEMNFLSFRHALHNNLHLLDQLLYQWGQTLDRLQQALWVTRWGGTKEHLAFLLYNLARCHANTSEEPCLQLQLTQTWLALQLGVSRETAARALSSLRQEGLITVGYGKITVCNLQGLEWVYKNRDGSNLVGNGQAR